MENIPIIIPSYKCREKNILNDYCNGLCLQNRKVISYIYKDEYELYKKYEHKVELRLLDVDWRSIVKKRKYILEHIEYDLFWMLDDDIKPIGKKKIGKGYTDSVDISLDEQLKIVENDFNTETDGIFGLNGNSTAFRFSKPDYITKVSCPSACVLINAKKARENNITYDSNTKMFEDVDIDLQFLKAGYNCKVYVYLFIDYYYKFGSKHTTTSTYDTKLDGAKFIYNKWGNCIKFWMVNKGETKFKINPKRAKNPEFDEKLLELINTGDMNILKKKNNISIFINI